MNIKILLLSPVVVVDAKLNMQGLVLLLVPRFRAARDLPLCLHTRHGYRLSLEHPQRYYSRFTLPLEHQDNHQPQWTCRSRSSPQLSHISSSELAKSLRMSSKSIFSSRKGPRWHICPWSKRSNWYSVGHQSLNRVG